jgi:fibronectin-binding autotransporter adhesin
LSAPSTQTVSVQYLTCNSTAIAGRDYQTTGGTAYFQPGTTEQYVGVNIYGTNHNTQLTFFLNLYNGGNGAVQTIYGYPVRGRGVILAK